MAGLEDLRGLFEPKLFYGSVSRDPFQLQTFCDTVHLAIKIQIILKHSILTGSSCPSTCAMLNEGNLEKYSV